MFEMDSLEKWTLDFSWRIINSAVFVKQKKTCLLKLLWNVVFLLIIIYLLECHGMSIYAN